MSAVKPSLADAGLARPATNSYVYDTLFVDGKWVPAGSDEVLPVYDCATEERLGSVRSASATDVAAGVTAAARAMPSWRRESVGARAEHLRRLQAALADRAPELASVIAAEVGTAARMSLAIQVNSAISLVGMYAEQLLAEPFEEWVANSLVVSEPVGVVAAITPWNYPLFQTMGKVAAALAAGCTVVHKPSELAPVSAFILAEAVERAGLPPGVYNLIPGLGPTVGEQLASSPAVQMVSFTGSTPAGRRVYELGAPSLKRVALELGGKSASVLLDDADLERAVKSTVNRAFINSGQTCDAWTRLLVPRSLVSDVLDVAAAQAERLTLGDPFEEGTKLGPLISAKQLARVRGYVTGALEQGAKAAHGGPEPVTDRTRGHYFRPTILNKVTPDMQIAREEVFGPVLVVLTFDTDAEATEIANATDYGLGAAVWSADQDRALSFARGLESGQVVVNGGAFNPLAPFGGVKQSGIGRELGVYGIREFLETKALQC